MTNNETITELKNRIAELEEELKLCQRLHTELFLSYEKLKDKNEELEEQLKKFTEPQKVKFNKFNGYRGTRFKCPNCNKQIENCIDYTADYYCKHCGQSVIYPKFRVVNNVGELYFEEAQAKLEELKGE